MEQKTYSKPYDPNYKKKPFVKYEKKPKEPEVAELYRTVGIFCNENPPIEVLDKAKIVAALLQEHEFTLRTDTTSALSPIFEEAISRKEIYLPWKGFKELDSKFYFSSEVSKEVAGKFHSNFETIKDTAKAFLSRNVRIVLGNNMKSNVSILVIWSADGAENKASKTPKTGYLLHPINIASKINIPIFNLQNENSLDRIKSFLTY